VYAVASNLGISLPHVKANPMIDYIAAWTTPTWWKVSSPQHAGKYSEEGYFVVAGLKDESGSQNPHGHMVVVTSSHESANGIYPRGYWGKLGGVGMKNSTINWAFEASDLAGGVTYWRHMARR